MGEGEVRIDLSILITVTYVGCGVRAWGRGEGRTLRGAMPTQAEPSPWAEQPLSRLAWACHPSVWRCESNTYGASGNVFEIEIPLREVIAFCQCGALGSRTQASAKP